jgi:chromosome partitioning protein
LARITACCLQKGGTGKSTTSHALSAGLVRRGFKVLLIDTDPQGNLSHSMQADTNKRGLFEALNGENIVELIQQTTQGHIVASSSQLTGADKKFTEVSSEYLLVDALAPVMDAYDFIIIDCPPQLGVLTVNALVAATDIIIPITSDIYAIQGLAQLLSNIEKIKRRANPSLLIDGILLTRYSSRSILSRDLKESIEARAAEMGTKLYNTIIREGVSIREAQTNKMNIFEYAPTSNQALDYNDFISEYLKEGGKKHG